MELVSMNSLKQQSETYKLAEWIARVRHEDIPGDVVRRAKDCILDNLGCMIAGSNTKPCRIQLAVISQRDAQGKVLVPGAGHKLSLLPASYFMSEAANALDFDDSFRDGAPSHPGATIIPPAFAIAQEFGLRGLDLLRAVVVGYEASLRIGRAIQPTPERKRKVYGFSTWQIFGSVSAAVSLLNLPEDKVANAFGITGITAPVPSCRYCEDTKPLPWAKNAYGIASQTGVMAALLAAEGYIGGETIFEGDCGFWIISGSDRYQPELITADLGKKWWIREVGFKQYGCCRWTHTMLDALRSLIRMDNVSDRIQKVEVFCFGELTRLTGSAPTSIIDAQLHAPHLAALEIIGRSPQFGLQESDLIDVKIAQLRDKVILRHDPSLDEPYYRLGTLPVRVVLHLTDGTMREIFREHPSGSPGAGGLSKDDLEDKFIRLTSPLIGCTRSRQIVKCISELEKLHITDLIELFY